MEKKYIEKSRIFESVKIPLTLFQEGPLGIVPAYNGKNAEGNKGITYGPERIIEVHPFINAVDIDWNGAKVSSSGKTINTTAELFNWIGEKQAGKSAFLIAQQLDSSLENELQWLASLKGERGEKGEKGSKGDQGELGETPQLIFGQTITLEPGQDAGVDVSPTGNGYKLTFKIPLGKPGTPGRDGECQTEGGQSIGQVNKIESISIDGGESIKPDINKNVNINLQGYLAENLYIQQDTLEERLATKLDTLESRDNLKVIKYLDTKGSTTDYKYISFLPSDGSYKKRINTSSYSYATDPLEPTEILMSKVAFTGLYSDLLNTPNDDRYEKIFRKSLREEATMYYPDKDSVQRVVYKIKGAGEKSEIEGETINTYTKEECNEHNSGTEAWLYHTNSNIGQIYTNEETAAYNSHLDGAIISGDVLTAVQVASFNEKFIVNYLEGDILSEENLIKYNRTLTDALYPGILLTAALATAVNSVVSGANYIENLRILANDADAYNKTLTGAFSRINNEDIELTAGQALAIHLAISKSYEVGQTISLIDATAYNETLYGHIKPYNANFYRPDEEVTSHNLGVTGAITIRTIKSDDNRLNRYGESRFIQNYVLGDHSVALGWGCLIGNANDNTKGNHSFVEGKWTNVLGNFSHASGLQTKVNGDYSFSGGLNLNDGEVNSHYSFAYGKDLQTNNNGEIAFGEYNKSTTIESLRVPNLESEELAYDSLGNPWKVIDFYNIDLDQLPDYYLRFSSNIDLDFGDYLSGHENYNFGYVLSNTGYFEFIDKVFDFIINPQDGEYQNINDFLNGEIFDINWHKSIYTYLYEVGSLDYGHGVNNGDRCIIGVIAQRIDENGELIPILDNNENPIYIYEGTENLVQAYESLFFVWGPNTLYYKLDEPLTMLSIGNGNLNERSNLIEVTNDGNIHYANGEKNLFELESQLNNISHNINLEVNNISTNNSSIDDSDLTIKKLIIPINDNTPSILIVDDFIKHEEENNNKNRHIYLDILNSQHSYYKKTLIIDLNKFYSITDGKIFIEPSLSISVYGKEGIATGNMLELSSYGENEDGICRIILETIQNKCIVEFDECLKKIETE